MVENVEDKDSDKPCLARLIAATLVFVVPFISRLISSLILIP